MSAEGARVNKIRGFTLLELMIVMAIAGILAVAAVPVYTNISEKSRFRTTVDDAFESLRYARQLAIAKEVISSSIDFTRDSGEVTGWTVTKHYKDASGTAKSDVVRTFQFDERYRKDSSDNLSVKTDSAVDTFDFNQLGIVKDKVTRRILFCYTADSKENRVIEIYGSGSIEKRPVEKDEGISCGS